MDLGTDIRSLMSVEPDAYWWETAHHELGHGYSDMSYTRPEVPPLTPAVLLGLFLAENSSPS